MGRDPFDALVGITTPSVIQQINLRQLQLQQSLGAYANHHIATPDLHIANRRSTYVPKIVGEDGQEMTMERRAQLMQGKPTMADLAVSGADPMDVGDYTQLFTEQDIGLEELGAAAVANRAGFRQVVACELELPTELLARQGLPGEMQDMSLCCYSAPFLTDGRMLWAEMGVAILKIRALSEAGIGPEQLLMSQTVQALLSGWAGQEVGTHFMGLPVFISDRLKNEIRLCATSSIPELRCRYASLFIDQDLYASLEIELEIEIDTALLPAIKPPPIKP